MSDSRSSGQNVQRPTDDTSATKAIASESSLISSFSSCPSTEEPTIISNRPPTPSAAVSDSAYRILEGRIMPGDHLGHFELIEYVGGGGMGRVFRATDTRLARTVALKILPPDQAADPETVERFRNEAQSAARLDHENIARVHYVGEDRGIPFIVFEFVEGENIRKLVERKGPLPLDETINYTLQALDALAHADARQIVHRDIKPSNILITPAGRVKLIDMGLARLRQADSLGADLTASGVTLGSFDYISPEQARDPRNADFRSDIYSLGCTLFFMLTGRPPFPQGTVLQKLLQHHGDPPPDVRQLRADLPEEANRVLQKMLAKDPRNRYLDPGELTADLMFLAHQAGLQPASPSGKVWLPKSAPKVSFFHRYLPWLVTVAALVCIVIVIYVFLNSGNPTISSISPSSLAGRSQVAESTHKRQPSQEAPSISLPLDAVQDDSARLIAPAAKISSQVAPGENTSTTVTSAKHNGLLVVSNQAAGENEFTNLAAACTAAHNGDVIELRYNGRREEKPIRAANLRATIRAGDGYRPVVVFQGDKTDPVNYPRSMLSLSSSRLTFSNLAIEFNIPRDIPADNWSLVEIHGGQTVRLEKCVLTIVNASDQMTAYHQDVAFFRVGSSPGADAMAAGDNSGAPPLVSIEMIDSVVRGEAVFISVEDPQPVYLSWDNGLLVTSERLLSAAGGAQPPKPDETHRIDLRHVTVAARGGLVRLAGSQAAPYQFTVQFNCADNIIITSPGNPLIEQEVLDQLENARRQIVWNGDHNFYQDTGIFWIIRNLDAQPWSETLNFEGWQKYWGSSRENQPFSGRIEWNDLPGPDRPVHAQTPADYNLDEMTGENPAVGAAGDGSNAGMQAERLMDFIVK